MYITGDKVYIDKERVFYSKVYDILIEYGKAGSSMKNDFIEAHLSSNDYECFEWRFSGNLGFGGKYRKSRNSVDCYREDETKERVKIIETINNKLKELNNINPNYIPVEN